MAAADIASTSNKYRKQHPITPINPPAVSSYKQRELMPDLS